MPVVGDRVIDPDVLNHQAVGVGVEFDLAGSIEDEFLEAEVPDRADADAEVLVAAQFQVRLIVDLELANVGDVAQRDIFQRAVEFGSVIESLHAGQETDRTRAACWAGHILD